MKRPREVFDWFLPPAAAADPDLRRQARMIIGFAAAGVPFLLFFGLRDLLVGFPRWGWVSTSSAVLVAWVPLLLRATRSVKLAGHVLAGLVLAQLLVQIALGGGFRIEFLIWTLAIPIGVLLVGWRYAAVVWTLVLLAVYTTVYVLSTSGALPMIEHLDPASGFRNLVGVLALVVVLVLAHDAVRRRLEGEKELLERELSRSERLESVRLVAAGIAHEFNNLLTVVEGYGSLLLDSLDAADPRRRDVEEVLRASRRGSELTQQMLTFTRQQKMEPVLIDVNALLVSMEPLVKRLAGGRIEVITRLQGDLPRVRADREQLTRAIINLVLNGLEAMPDGGKLLIETVAVDLTEQDVAHHAEMKPGAYVRLAVTDTGRGIPPNVLDRIFEPFFTTKPAGEGIGLGLSTAYGIVRQADGHLFPYSEPDIGTTFKVYLPRAAEPARTEERPEGEPAARTAKTPSTPSENAPMCTILVVDDQPVLARATKRLLSRAGYDVLIASRTDDVRRTWTQGRDRIDLLLTDVVMPGLSGPELAEELRNDRPDLKVIFMSGYTEATVENLTGNTHGIRLLEKPFGPEELLEAVRLALESHHADNDR